MPLNTKLPSWCTKPVSRWGLLLAILVILCLPAVLFADSLLTYRLHSDDFEYLARSRTWSETQANLFRPHNTHIVPVWRVLTWAVMAVSGTLARLQPVLAAVSYLALVITMLSAGRLVALETGRQSLGLLAMLLLGTTSVLWSSATWYSSGQTLWAASGIVLSLLCLQNWKRHRNWTSLGLATIFGWLAGGFWTIGHAAGPVGAIYLACDQRATVRKAAFVPLLTTLAGVALALALGGQSLLKQLQQKDPSHHRSTNLVAGVTHTFQAIPENLVAQNLGVEAITTMVQGVVLTGILVGLWIWSWARRTGGRPLPLECAGLVMVFLAYFVEWTFRGYLPYFSLRGMVRWYDTIPHVGAVLFCCSWIGRILNPATASGLASPALPSGAVIAGLIGLQLSAVQIHLPRVEALLFRRIPPDSLELVKPLLLTRDLRRSAARDLTAELARRQRDNLARLDQASARARSLGIGRNAIDQVFGRVGALEIPAVYNAAGLLGLPPTGTAIDAPRLRSDLGALLRPSRLPVLSMTQEPDGRIHVSFGPEF